MLGLLFYCIEFAVAAVVSIFLAVFAILVQFSCNYVVFPLEKYFGSRAKTNTATLKNLNKLIGKQMRIIIVGPYGGGKTTLMNRIGDKFKIPRIDSGNQYIY